MYPLSLLRSMSASLLLMSPPFCPLFTSRETSLEISFFGKPFRCDELRFEPGTSGGEVKSNICSLPSLIFYTFNQYLFVALNFLRIFATKFQQRLRRSQVLFQVRAIQSFQLKLAPKRCRSWNEIRVESFPRRKS